MQIEYKPQVVKQMQKIPFVQRKKILHKLNQLMFDPLAGKTLRGELEGLRSLRAWPYRIVYELEKEKIIIYSIVHRQSVY